MKTKNATYQKNVAFTDAQGKSVFVEISINDGRLSMVGYCGGSGGQIVDHIEPANDAQKDLLAVWKDWHLNDLLTRELPADIVEQIEDIIARIGGEVFEGSSYEKRANDFLKRHGIEFFAEFHLHGKHFYDDEEERDIYQITLRRDGRGDFNFTFGQSLADSDGHGGNKPSAYSVLSCLTKNDPGTLEDFCSNYGYDTDSKRAEKIYNSVVDEWHKVQAFFSPEEIDELQEIN